MWLIGPNPATFTVINLIASISDAKVPCCAVAIILSFKIAVSLWRFQMLYLSHGSGTERKMAVNLGEPTFVSPNSKISHVAHILAKNGVRLYSVCPAFLVRH